MSKTCVVNKCMGTSPSLLEVSFHIAVTVFCMTYTPPWSMTTVDMGITRKTFCCHCSFL